MEWRELKKDSRDHLKKEYGFVFGYDSVAMFGFASLCFWSKVYNIKYAVLDDNIVFKSTNGKGDTSVYFPCGLRGDVRSFVEKLCGELNKTPVFSPLTESLTDVFRKLYPNAKITYMRDRSEYVYNSTDLTELKGKKYHAKRNHIAKFDRLYDCEYIRINESNIDILREAACRFFEMNGRQPEDEYIAIEEALDSFFELGLKGAVLRVDGKPIAYSIGSEIDGFCADIHFEKAERSYEGSYAKINNMFAKEFSHLPFIDREEDIGIEGLRKAKLSYFPCRMNNMYRVEI